MMMQLYRDKNQRGFTLIELMVVVAIISILATLALPRFEKFQEKALLTESTTMISTIGQSLEIYRIENNGSTPVEDGTNEIGATRINALGLNAIIPDDSYFEYYLSAYALTIFPTSVDNLRIGARNPAGLDSTTVNSFSVNLVTCSRSVSILLL